MILWWNNLQKEKVYIYGLIKELLCTWNSMRNWQWGYFAEHSCTLICSITRKKPKISHFPVIINDTLSKKIRKNECSAITLDFNIGSRTRWTADTNHSQKFVYIDNYSKLKSAEDLGRYFRSDSSKKYITFNYHEIKNLNSHKCVHYCLAFFIITAKVLYERI